VAVTPPDHETPGPDELRIDRGERHGRVGAGTRDATLLAHAPALGARAIPAQVIERVVRDGPVRPAQRERRCPIELDVGGGCGVGQLVGHAPSVAHAEGWG